MAKTGDPGAISALGSLSRSGSVEHRAAAVKGLVQMDRKETLPLLIDALGDDSREVWGPVSRYLVSKAKEDPDLRLVREIQERLRKTGGSRTGLLQTLAILDDPDARREVEGWLQSGTAADKHDVLQALISRSRPDDLSLVLPLFEETDRGILQSASIHLGKMKCRPAIVRLIPLLEKEDAGIVANAHWALRQITGLNYGPEAPAWRSWLGTAGNMANTKD
jgi:HEAT repeat protein